MKKLDKKLFFNILVGVLAVSFFVAVANLFFSTIEYLSFDGDLEWPFFAMFLGLLGGIASLVLFVVRHFKNNKGLTIAAVATDLSITILLFVFYFTLIGSQGNLVEIEINAAVRALLLQLFIPSLLLVFLVDIPDMVKMNHEAGAKVEGQQVLEKPTDIQE